MTNPAEVSGKLPAQDLAWSAIVAGHTILKEIADLQKRADTVMTELDQHIKGMPVEQITTTEAVLAQTVHAALYKIFGAPSQ